VSETIPVVDLSDFSNPERHAEFVRVLGEGLERYGFVAVTGHGIPVDLLERAYGAARDAFALPLDVKQRYEYPSHGRQRGYTSFGVEHAKDQLIPDLKEFWHIGRKLPPGHPLRESGEVPKNRPPEEVPAFRPVFDELFLRMEEFANRLLVAVAEYLGQDANFFRHMVQDGNSVLRVIHYPDMGHTIPAGAVRAAAHEDINLLTVLPVSTRPGLELLRRDGTWMPVHTPPDVMVCDTGDMMARITGGKLPSTTHRVVNPGGSDGGRYSMPFFLHPHPDHVLTPLFAGGEAPVTTRDFLNERLRAIGLGNFEAQPDETGEVPRS